MGIFIAKKTQQSGMIYIVFFCFFLWVHNGFSPDVGPRQAAAKPSQRPLAMALHDAWYQPGRSEARVLPGRCANV